MKHPLTILFPACLVGLLLYVGIYFFHLSETAIIVLSVIAILCIPALMQVVKRKYENWFAKQINPYLNQYKKDHKLDSLWEGLNKYETKAYTRNNRSALIINQVTALIEHGKYEDAIVMLEAFHKKGESFREELLYHECRIQCFKKQGNSKQVKEEEQEKRKLEQMAKHMKGKTPAMHCKKAFFRWVPVLLIFVVVCSAFATATWIAPLQVVTVPVAGITFCWGFLWFFRMLKEKKMN